jgi:hypothetical protein
MVPSCTGYIVSSAVSIQWQKNTLLPVIAEYEEFALHRVVPARTSLVFGSYYGAIEQA